MRNSLKELTEGMQRLCAIANKIVAHGDEVSRIELDLLLEDLRRLYDVALGMCEDNGRVDVPLAASKEEHEESAVVEPDEEILSSTVMATMAAMGAVAQPVESQPEKPHEESAVEQKQLEPEVPVEQPRMEDLEHNDNALLFDEIIIEEEKPESVSQEIPPVVEHETAPVVVEAEPIAEKEEDPMEEPVSEPGHQAAGTQASLLDYLKRPVEEKPTVRTLGEKLGGVESGERRVESGLDSGKKISDLRTVININDKFSFMSELFHNNMKAYNDFILRLNAIDNRDEALLCVNEVSAQYRWDEASLAVQSFYKVFDKKF